MIGSFNQTVLADGGGGGWERSGGERGGEIGVGGGGKGVGGKDRSRSGREGGGGATVIVRVGESLRPPLSPLPPKPPTF